MSNDAVERYYGQDEFERESLVLALFGWLFRAIGAFGIMLVWSVIVLLFAALLTPPTLPADSVHSTGATLAVALHKLLGLITVVYYVCVLPLVILPTKDEEQFNWFVVTALGWIGCLLSAVIFLTASGQAQIQTNFVSGKPLMFGAVGGVFAIGMAFCFLTGGESGRRLMALVALALAGGGLLIGLAIGDGAFVDSVLAKVIGFQPDSTFKLIVYTSISFILVFAFCSYAVAGISSEAGETFSLLTLILGFVLAVLLIAGLMNGAVKVIERPTGNQFRCLVGTAIAAPFISWLGMPWTKGRRFGWTLVLLVAGLATNWFVDHRPYAGNRSLLDQVWREYDGTRLSPRLATE